MQSQENSINIALIQMTSGQNLDENLRFLIEHIKEAALGGADYIQTPENSLLMELDGKKLAGIVSSTDYDTALSTLFNLAGELGIWLHIGSAAIALPISKTTNPDQKMLANRSFLIGPDYSANSPQDHHYFYDKIHMFDVTLPNGERYHESGNYQAGNKAVVVDCGFAKFGMTICYDLRFPALFRHLAHAGAEIISVPAAFTKTTGEAHWHTLLQARAIETGCFVVASGQTGLHQNGRETFGHSLIVAPWGDILLDAGTEPGVYCQQIDIQKVNAARQIIPSLQHDRNFD